MAHPEQLSKAIKAALSPSISWFEGLGPDHLGRERYQHRSGPDDSFTMATIDLLGGYLLSGAPGQSVAATARTIKELSAQSEQHDRYYHQRSLSRTAERTVNGQLYQAILTAMWISVAGAEGATERCSIGLTHTMPIEDGGIVANHLRFRSWLTETLAPSTGAVQTRVFQPSYVLYPDPEVDGYLPSQRWLELVSLVRSDDLDYFRDALLPAGVFKR